MKQPMFVEVQGKSGAYNFQLKGDPKHLAEWRAEGLSVYVIEYAMPEWAASLGLARPWGAVQKFWRILRLW